MKFLNTTRRLYNEVNTEILIKFNGDKELLDSILSDFICFKIFADYDYQLNSIIKRFLLSHDIEPKKKEIGKLKPSEIKKFLKKRFLIPNEELCFLDNRKDFTHFIIERHLISHTPNTVSVSFEKANEYINEAEEILSLIDTVLKNSGKIKKNKKILKNVLHFLKQKHLINLLKKIAQTIKQ